MLYSLLYVYSLCIYGGGNRSAQIEAVRKGVEIIIGVYIFSKNGDSYVASLQLHQAMHGPVLQTDLLHRSLSSTNGGS